jgi:hypothetical protein
MNLADPFKQLMDRRLWPLALLLVAALVAVPMVLKKSDSGAPAVTPTAVTADPNAASPTDAVVALADSGRNDKVRSVLGDRKDPFRPAQIHKVPKLDTGVAAEKTNLPSLDPAPSSDAPASTGGGTTAPSPSVDVPTVTVPEEPKPTYELYSLVASFGDTAGDQTRKVIERLTGLPGGNPAVLYLGLLKDHKTAAFIVDAGVQVTGDGKCDPSPEDCQTLTLKAGETEFFTRGEITYELDLEKVITKKTFDATEAKAARVKVAKGGAQALRKHARGLPFKYSKATGVLSSVASKSKSGSHGFAGGTIDSTG